MNVLTRLRPLFPLLALVAGAPLLAAEAGASLRRVSGPEFDRVFLRQMINHHNQGVLMAELGVQNGEKDAVKQFATKTATNQQKEIQELQTLLTGTDTVADPAGHDSSAPLATAPNAPATVDGAGNQRDVGTGAVAPRGETSAAVPSPGTPRMAETSDQIDSPGAQRFSDTMNRLQESSGGTFDRNFVNEMIAHHTEGLELAQLARDKASAASVRSLAEKLARNQSAELQELQRLRSQTNR